MKFVLISAGVIPSTTTGDREKKSPVEFWASSAESVGRFWFREPSQVMIQGNFHGVEGAKAVGSSGYYTDFVVETFHGAIGDFPFRPEPIQDQRFMGPQHPGHPFDRLQFAAHGPEAPIVEKGPGPDRGFVPPEMSEGLLQIPGPGGGQLAASRAWSFCRARPRTRLPRRSNSQRMCLSFAAASLLLARRRVLSARRT